MQLLKQREFQETDPLTLPEYLSEAVFCTLNASATSPYVIQVATARLP